MRVSAGDTTWILVSAALVMFMTLGISFFNGASTKKLLYCLTALSVATTVWVLIGHTFAFGPDIGRVIGHGGWLGGLDFLGFRGVGATPSVLAPTVPHIAFASYQLMIAGFAAAVIAGAFAERMRFSALVALIFVWSLVVYAPIEHWVFGGGLLGRSGLGAIDFAGGLTVHESVGMAALAAVFVLGRGIRREPAATTVPFVALGASILWFGWFGFTGGHAAGSPSLTALAFTNTQLAAGAAIIGWLIVESIRRDGPTVIGAAKGALSGLVAVSAAAGSVRPWAALLIGAAAGVACSFIPDLEDRLDLDLAIFGVFYVGGLIGVLLTGVFAAKVGLVYSNDFTQLGKQAIASLATTVWSFGLTYVILKVVDLTIGLRPSEEVG